MKSNKLHIHVILLAGLCSVLSCKMIRPSVQGRETIPYVRALLADSLSGRYGLIRSYDSGTSVGSIAVIGDPETCLMLSDEFLACDRFDNIHGTRRSDRLPDFAGEVISLYMDEACAPYQPYIPNLADSLRKVTVANALSALDTVCLLAPFNVESTVSKDRAKVLILSNSLTSQYGRSDIDTLIRASGKKIPLLSPAHAMIDQVLSSGQRAFNIGVWTDSLTVASGVFPSVFSADYKARKASGSTLTAVTPEPEGDIVKRFYSFLDKWKESAAPLPLDAILLDDYGVNIDLLTAEIQKIRREETTEMLRYSKMLSKDLMFVDIVGALTTECYRTLRKTNRFTHNIAYPKAALYQTVSAYEGSRLILTDERYISSETRMFMEENAPLTMRFYVQN